MLSRAQQRQCSAERSKGKAPRSAAKARPRRAQQSKGSNDINMKNEKMKDSNLSPQQQALRRSIALYSERSGVSAATISVIAEKFIGLLAGRWEHLCDVALADDGSYARTYETQAEANAASRAIDEATVPF